MYRKLYNLLNNNDRNFSVEELCQRFGITPRALRLLKEDCLNSGLPVGSHHDRGYFLIRSINDLDTAKAKYMAQAKTELLRARQLDEAFDKYYQLRTQKQEVLF